MPLAEPAHVPRTDVESERRKMRAQVARAVGLTRMAYRQKGEWSKLAVVPDELFQPIPVPRRGDLGAAR